MSARQSYELIERRIEEEVRRDAERIFEEKRRKAGIEATMELNFLSDFTVVGEYVYGEAFPPSGRIVIDIYAPMAAKEAVTRTICEELMHLRHPELEHGTKFWRLVRSLIRD
jgi:hypothetical protein